MLASRYDSLGDGFIRISGPCFAEFGRPSSGGASTQQALRMNRGDLQALTRQRLREARALLRASHHSGAYYLAGYAVECALKACIAGKTQRYEFPDRERVVQSHTHKLDALVALAGLKKALEADMVDDAALRLNWNIVKQWSEHARYRTDLQKTDALELYSAISGRNGGLLPWIKRRW